jgi:glycosyltransferase involved in cell wall biosynthesis
MTPPAISVVIPLYNEEDNIVPLQEEVAAALTGLDYELILIDDCSKDATLQRIRRGPEVRVIEFAKNTGQSAAMYAGVNAARGAITVLLDGDRQNDPADIRRMIAKLDEGYDLVCGWRAQRQDSWSKKLTSRFANFVRSRFTRDGVHDTGCTLKVMRTACREALVPFYGMHRFIPALIKGMHYRITEMPVNHRPRVAGVSKYGFGNRAIKATMDMFAVRWLLSRQLQIRVKNDPGGAP